MVPFINTITVMTVRDQGVCVCVCVCARARVFPLTSCHPALRVFQRHFLLIFSKATSECFTVCLFINLCLLVLITSWMSNDGFFFFFFFFFFFLVVSRPLLYMQDGGGRDEGGWCVAWCDCVVLWCDGVVLWCGSVAWWVSD